MARIKCVGCGRVAHLRKYDASEGFAVCRQCQAVFDVSSDVVERAPSGVADLVAHGAIPEPPGVSVKLQGTDPEASRPMKGYRGNAREAAAPKMLLLTCRTHAITERLVGGVALAVVSAGSLGMFLAMGMSALWTRLLMVLVVVLPGICSIYYLLMGFGNGARIRIADGLVHVDEGPFPYPHKKFHVPTAIIDHVCCHFVTSTFRTGTTKSYQIEAWLRSGRRQTLVAGIESVTAAIYIQQRLGAFLGIESSGPVEYKSYKADPDFFGD